MAKPDQTNLLDEVLLEQQEAFRNASLHETLRLARRRRRVRQMRPVLPALAVLAMSAWLWWRPAPPAPSPVKQESRTYAIISTSPLAAERVVTTAPLPPELIVTSSSDFALVETRDSEHRFRDLSDGELIALAGARPTVLVRYGARSATLFFVDQSEAEPLDN